MRSDPPSGKSGSRDHALECIRVRYFHNVKTSFSCWVRFCGTAYDSDSHWQFDGSCQMTIIRDFECRQ